METSHRHWDVAPLILVGVALGMLGLAVAGDGSSRGGLVAGAAMALAGFVLLLAGLGRWAWRTRRTRESAVASVPEVASARL